MKSARRSVRLAKLHAARSQYGPGCAARVEKLLASLQAISFADAESLIQFHDSLLFLRAFPQSHKVVVLTEGLLGRIGQEARRLIDSEVASDLFDSEQFSGIAGTIIRDTFTYEVARWLWSQFPQSLKMEWDPDEHARQTSSSLPQIVPLLADDCLVEADTPYREWLSAAAGGEDQILPWLMRRLQSAPGTPLEKTAWYDALKVGIAWELGDSLASRTCARRNPYSLYYHTGPLISRKQVSLADELNSPALPTRKLLQSEGEEVLNLTRAALTVRYRELWGTTRGDASQVIEADVGRGTHIFLWGLPPERRLPLRAYFAGITLKNGVPINYIEAIGLAEWMEIGFNTFYAFREGESAWIYSKVLHLLQQLAGTKCFSVYPYQLGQDNEEAIKSGAFWFYRKLGFRPGKPELLKLTEREEARIAKTPGYRSSARTLRRVASEHVFYESEGAQPGLWDTFSTRNIGFAVQHRMAENFAGDPAKMRQSDTEYLRESFNMNPEKWTPGEQDALANFGPVLRLLPGLPRWSKAEKDAAVEIIRAKAGATERSYLQKLQQHDKLKQGLLRLGSSASSVPTRGSLATSASVRPTPGRWS